MATDPRTQKQREADRATIQAYVEEGDLLAASMVARLIRREREYTGDVFGNPCRCRMNDDDRWASALCPIHNPEPWEADDA